MRLAFDTNALVYAEGLDGVEKQAVVMDIVSRLPKDRKLVPVNVLGELFNVLIRKGGRSRPDARAAVLSWRRASGIGETTDAAMAAALHLAAEHKLSIWDALVLAVAAEADCRVVLSENMQDGFTWRGVTVINPFAAPLSPLLSGVLRP